MSKLKEILLTNSPILLNIESMLVSFNLSIDGTESRDMIMVDVRQFVC